MTLIRPTVDSPAAEVIDPLAPVNPSGDLIPDDRPDASPHARMVRAMLFADVKGFSLLSDEQSLTFANRVLGAFATVLERYRDEVRHRRTWGDALFLVLTDAPAAARCALDLQDAIASIDFAAVGLPGHLALRLGAHLGPVFRYHDPVIDGPDFTGSHVSRAARIEPVTPPGAVYVTEPFAAALVLAGQRDLTCDYVGHMPMAKDYGRLRMYRLRRVESNADIL